jgi:hypothetical protein
MLYRSRISGARLPAHCPPIPERAESWRQWWSWIPPGTRIAARPLFLSRQFQLNCERLGLLMRVMNRQLKQTACPWRRSLRIGASETLASLLSVGPSSTDKAVAHHDAGLRTRPPAGKYDPTAARSHGSIGQFWVFVGSFSAQMVALSNQRKRRFAPCAVPPQPEGRGFSRRFR